MIFYINVYLKAGLVLNVSGTSIDSALFIETQLMSGESDLS